MDLSERRRQLGREMAGRARLYLDIRFWNDLCDAAIARQASDGAVECLGILREAVGQKRLVCPIEYYAFLELRKQKLEEKRAATLALVDELSMNTVMLNPFERVFVELLRFAQAAAHGRLPTARPIDEMWTRPAYVVGHSMPELPPSGFPPDLDRLLREQFFDDLWNFGLTDIVRLSDPLPAPNEVRTAELLNESKADPTTEFRSLEETYRSEIRGTLDGYSEQVENVVLYLFRQAGGDLSSVTEAQRKAAARRWRDVYYNAILKPGGPELLPSLHVGATLYARMQWDRKRVYKSNDVFDFGHAEAAIPYCSAFATDGALASAIRQAGLDRYYRCRLLTSTDEIVDWVRAGCDATVASG